MYGALGFEVWEEWRKHLSRELLHTCIWTESGAYLRRPVWKQARYFFVPFEEETLEEQVRLVCRRYQLEWAAVYLLWADDSVLLETRELPFACAAEAVQYLQLNEADERCYGTKRQTGGTDWTIASYPIERMRRIYHAFKKERVYIWRSEALAPLIAQYYRDYDGVCRIWSGQHFQDIALSYGNAAHAAENDVGELLWKIDLNEGWTPLLQDIVQGKRRHADGI